MKTSLFSMKTRYIKVYSLALVLLASLAISAEAKDARTHAFACKTLGGTPIDRDYALFNDSPTQDMVVVCAIADTDYFRKENLTTLNVHGYDGHFNRDVNAMTCYSTWHTTGGFCGFMHYHPFLYGRGDYTIQVSRIWGNSLTGNFGYLWVRIPPKEGSSRSNFRGYFTSGN